MGDTSHSNTLINLNVRGMTCAACAARIEKGLSKLPGVSKANVNFAAERVTVEFDPRAIDASQIKS